MIEFQVYVYLHILFVILLLIFLHSFLLTNVLYSRPSDNESKMNIVRLWREESLQVWMPLQDKQLEYKSYILRRWCYNSIIIFFDEWSYLYTLHLQLREPDQMRRWAQLLILEF